MKNILIVMWSSLVMLGCLPEDERVEPFDRGDLDLAQVEMGVRYSQHLFFDLSEGKVTGKALRTSWDVGISFVAGEEAISLNTANFQEVAFSGESDFSKVSGQTRLDFHREYADAPLPQLRKSNLMSGEVFVLALGTSPSGVLLDTVKCQVAAWEAGKISLHWAPLEANNFFISEVEASPAHNLQYFSFSEGGKTMAVAPPDTDWDLWFTTYTLALEADGEVVPYLVNGVLTNPLNKGVGRLDSLTFADIDALDASAVALSDSITAIGYSWKEFDFGTGTYSISSNFHYIVQDQTGFWFKLRFVDFYNDAGDKGHPSFEFQLL